MGKYVTAGEVVLEHCNHIEEKWFEVRENSIDPLSLAHILHCPWISKLISDYEIDGWPSMHAGMRNFENPTWIGGSKKHLYMANQPDTLQKIEFFAG